MTHTKKTHFTWINWFHRKLYTPEKLTNGTQKESPSWNGKSSEPNPQLFGFHVHFPSFSRIYRLGIPGRSFVHYDVPSNLFQRFVPTSCFVDAAWGHLQRFLGTASAFGRMLWSCFSGWKVFQIWGPAIWKGCQMVPGNRLSIHHPLGFKDGTPTWRSRDFWFGYTKAILGFVELPSYCSSFAKRSIDLGRYLSDMGCSPTLLWRRRKFQRSRGVTNEFRVNKQVYDMHRYNKKQRCKSSWIWVPPISAQGSVHVCIGNTQVDRFFPAMFHQFKRTCMSRVPVLTVENSWDI